MTAAGSLLSSTFSAPALTLVIGGARSGKSAIAERLVTATRRPRSYIATAQAFDAEMEDRIARHRTDRGTGWHTIEAPRDVAEALAQIDPGGIALLDCATLWLTNVMLAGEDVAKASAELAQTLAQSPVPVVVVSNEVGWSIVPENALARQFRDAQGRLNQLLARRAGLVVAAMAGLPLTLKGALPPDVL